MTKTLHSTVTRRGAVLATVTTGVVLSTVSALSGAPAQAADLGAAAGPVSAYTGDAFGTSVNLGSQVRSGRSAPVDLGCDSKAGVSRSNTSAGLALPPLGTTGTVATTATTGASPVRSATTARIEQVSLLGGMIRATAIKAASATTRSGGSFSVSPAGTTLLGLRIAGHDEPAGAAPNTRVDLPGVGYVVLNEQSGSNTAKGALLDVNGLHLVVTQKNMLGVAVGSNVVVSHARSGLSAPVAGLLRGAAYGSRVHVGGVGASGPSFQKLMPCLGTGGVVKANTGAGLTLGSLTTGAVRNTAKGTADDTSVVGEMTSTVDATNLLQGMVKATVIKADAHAAKTGAARTHDADGSTFGTLAVKGHPEITADVPANTTVQLPGVGTLYLRRVLPGNGGVEVRMIELVLSAPQDGLAAGADLRIAVANVAVD